MLRQELSAVSFDNRNYRFVKEFLEPLLEDEIVFHSWYGPKIYDAKFQQKVLSSPLYQDQRIKTFLSPFSSDFNL